MVYACLISTFYCFLWTIDLELFNVLICTRMNTTIFVSTNLKNVCQDFDICQLSWSQKKVIKNTVRYFAFSILILPACHMFINKRRICNKYRTNIEICKVLPFYVSLKNYFKSHKIIQTVL